MAPDTLFRDDEPITTRKDEMASIQDDKRTCLESESRSRRRRDAGYPFFSEDETTGIARDSGQKGRNGTPIALLCTSRREAREHQRR